VLHEHVAGDTLIMEQLMTGIVIGSMLGLSGNGRHITFRMLHVFEFSNGLISRENVWIDTAAIAAQLGATAAH
jgi:predicted ester cyclase